MVDAYCRDCIYRGSAYGGSCCCFFEMTKIRRGCPSGKGCTRKVRGDKPRSLSQLNLHKPKAPEKEKKPIVKLSHEEIQRRQTERKRKAAAEYRAKAQGRQKAAIEEYKKEHKLTFAQFAGLLGISDGTLQHWVYENYPANWELLGKLGIEKPEGL